MRAAAADPSGYVMKPQREGGGHNLFGATLAAALRELSRAQRSAYILMRRIEPKAAPAVLVRAGEVYRGYAVSELGVYSTYLRSATGRVLISRPAGHLVRTKMRGVDRGREGSPRASPFSRARSLHLMMWCDADVFARAVRSDLCMQEP